MQAAISAFQKCVFNATTETLQSDRTQFDILQISQEIRARLSAQAFILVLAVACVYIWGLWDYTNQLLLVFWSTAVVLIAAIRAWYCRNLLQNISNATPARLIRNEAFLFVNGVVYALAIGSAYWLVALNSDVRTVFAVTTMSSMYAIGTTANSSLHFRTFAIFTILNLCQGVAFFLFDSHRVDTPVMMTLIVSMILLLRFGHRNSELFKKSVSRRLENVAQNTQLRKNQLIIENSLNNANEANTSKSRFLAAASHDLRQPLHALSLFLGSLRNTKTSADQDELLEYIQQSTETLTTQFNSLLDLTQLDSGVIKTNVIMFDLHPLMQKQVDAFRLDAIEKHVAINYDGDQTLIQSDPLLLDRVVRNILTNALKYTDSGSITIHCEKSEGDVNISIADTGCGIAEQDQAYIFEEFAQIGNPERQVSEGSGLGLAIVRRITTMLGITVSVQSASGHGSTFKLSIPRLFSSTSLGVSVYGDSVSFKRNESTFSADTKNTIATAEAANSDQSSIRLTGMKMLVVDDDPTILIAFSRFLEARGAEVVACGSYQAAVAIEEPTSIDFAFLDDMLAISGSGLDIANWLAGFIDKRHISLVTGSENPQRINEIRTNGFSVYKKPLSLSQLDGILLTRTTLRDA